MGKLLKSSKLQGGPNYTETTTIKSVQDFLIKLDMKPCMYVCNGNKHFFTKSCHRQTYQNHEQPPRTFQKLYLQSHFSVLKIGKLVESFQNNFSMKNIWLGDQLLLKMFLKIFIFQILYFLKLGLIFVGSVHNFGRSDDLVI